MSPAANEIANAVEREARRVEEDCAYSSKGHYNAAASWSHTHLWIGIPTAVLAAVASGTAFSDQGIIAGCIGIVVTALTALATFLDPSGKSNEHRSAANQYLSLRNLTRIFRELELPDADAESLKKRIKELAAHRDSLNESSLRIPEKAFAKVKQGIEAGESTHAVDNSAKG